MILMMTTMNLMMMMMMLSDNNDDDDDYYYSYYCCCYYCCCYHYFYYDDNNYYHSYDHDDDDPLELGWTPRSPRFLTGSQATTFVSSDDRFPRRAFQAAQKGIDVTICLSQAKRMCQQTHATCRWHQVDENALYLSVPVIDKLAGNTVVGWPRSASRKDSLANFSP